MKNDTCGRYVFNSDQKKDEPIDAYVGELQTLAQLCHFRMCLHDTLIRDWIVLGPTRYNSFDLGEANRHKLTEILKGFDNFAIGETNETYESYGFNSRDQKKDEPLDAHVHVGELQTLAQSCHSCTCLHDTLIRDWIVLGPTRWRPCNHLLGQGKLRLQSVSRLLRVIKCQTHR